MRLPDGSEFWIAGRARCPVVVAPEGMPFCLDCLRRGRQPECPAGEAPPCPAADKWLLENGR